MTVNITCPTCDGRRLCEACRAAARILTAAGYRIEHSTRYAALRAAATRSYGFDACVVPIGVHERAVLESAIMLFAGKRLLIVVDGDAGTPGSVPSNVAVIPRASYAAGDFSAAWNERPHQRTEIRPTDETATAVIDSSPADASGVDRAHATRRLKRVADQSRATVALAGLQEAPRLDMLAVLEDEVAWAHASGRGFGVVLVHLPGLSLSNPLNKEEQRAEDRLREAQSLIQTAVRSIDVVAGRGDDFLVLLGEADEAGAGLAALRIVAAIQESKLRAATKPKRRRGFAAWSLGRACYPTDGTTRDGLLARATASLEPL